MIHQYGIAIFDNGKSKHQRYFYEFEDDGESAVIDVRLLAGDWVTVNRKAVVRWPIQEAEAKE